MSHWPIGRVVCVWFGARHLLCKYFFPCLGLLFFLLFFRLDFFWRKYGLRQFLCCSRLFTFVQLNIWTHSPLKMINICFYRFCFVLKNCETKTKHSEDRNKRFEKYPISISIYLTKQRKQTKYYRASDKMEIRFNLNRFFFCPFVVRSPFTGSIFTLTKE